MSGDDDLFEVDDRPPLVWSDAEMARAVALAVWEADIEDEGDERRPNYDW